MRNLYKIANIALIFTLIGVFLCQDLHALRVPVGSDITKKRFDYRKSHYIKSIDEARIEKLAILTSAKGNEKNVKRGTTALIEKVRLNIIDMIQVEPVIYHRAKDIEDNIDSVAKGIFESSMSDRNSKILTNSLKYMEGDDPAEQSKRIKAIMQSLEEIKNTIENHLFKLDDDGLRSAIACLPKYRLVGTIEERIGSSARIEKDIRNEGKGFLKGLRESIEDRANIILNRIDEIKEMAKDNAGGGTKFYNTDFDTISIYDSTQDMLIGLRSKIPIKLKSLGFGIGDFIGAEGLLDLVETIYEDMGLLTKNCHNHAHNLGVTYAMLLLSEDLDLSIEDVKVIFLAGLLHDFHVRDIVDKKTGNATSALVEETLRQLDDIMGIEVYPGPAVDNARYDRGDDSRITHEQKKALKEGIRMFLGVGTVALDRRLYYEIVAMIRRSDFPSNVRMSTRTYKKKAEAIRMMMETKISEGTGVSDIIKTVKSEYKKVTDTLKEDDSIKVKQRRDTGIWIERQKGIEIDYLEALNKISGDRIQLIHKLSHRLEKGADQAGFYFLCTPDMIEKEIVPGLSNESPATTTKTTYPFFFNIELLRPEVLSMLSKLPEEYKDNFRKVVEHFSVLGNAKEDWDSKARDVAYSLGEAHKVWFEEFKSLEGFGKLTDALETLKKDLDPFRKAHIISTIDKLLEIGVESVTRAIIIYDKGAVDKGSIYLLKNCGVIPSLEEIQKDVTAYQSHIVIIATWLNGFGEELEGSINYHREGIFSSRFPALELLRSL